jgi:Protein of unknown function (DUF3761)
MRRLAATLVGLVLIAALASCGGSNDASTGSTSATATTTNAAPRQAVTPVRYTTCDQNISAGRHTSCGFADNVFRAFAEEAAQGSEEATVTAMSPATGKAYTVRCRTVHEVTVCAGAVNARVRFPLSAAKAYRPPRPEHESRTSTPAPESEEAAATPEAGEGSGAGSECTSGTYENSSGNLVCRPEHSPTAPAGATARCEDGTYSFSEHRSGTCSHHGGVAEWLGE